MPNYRRFAAENRPVFITLVSHHRQPILVDHRERLRVALRQTRRSLPFDITAMVLLPDHCHLIMQLPEGEDDFSTRVNQIKGRFSRAIPANYPTTNPSRMKRREREVWQRRFWEHVIRNEEELLRHLDYIHYNPVKHGLVARCRDWPWSSFHRYVRDGCYDSEWGVDVELDTAGE
ncbi:MAG: transposase [Pseudomonadota bacterium]